MTILTVPNHKLRQPTQAVTKVDNGLKQFIERLGQTLVNKKNPTGVGLAAPQVGNQKSVFATYLPDGITQQQKLAIFINPQVVDHSDILIIGENKKAKKAREEGCLSIPSIYGVVPRWQWVKFAFDQLEGNQLIRTEAVFQDFAARVMQHEYDHLSGILFTDRIIEHNLPVYKEINADKWEEIDPKILTKF